LAPTALGGAERLPLPPLPSLTPLPESPLPPSLDEKFPLPDLPFPAGALVVALPVPFFLPFLLLVVLDSHSSEAGGSAL